MSAEDTGRITGHYRSEGIADRLLAALRAVQGDAPVTPDALAPLDHFHGRGVRATAEMIALLGPRAGEAILDIGGGIGGPARWIAARTGCHVTSLDLTPEFCRAARELNAATGMSDRVRVVEGSATALPFPEASFDRAYSENVAMNIADKRRFFAEALRVLKPGGVFAFVQYGSGPAGAPDYPLPWAAVPEASFLASPEQTGQDALAAGFELLRCHDRTAEVLADLLENRRRLLEGVIPPLGLHVLVGPGIRERQINVATGAEQGRLSIIEGLGRKPG